MVTGVSPRKTTTFQKESWTKKVGKIRKGTRAQFWRGKKGKVVRD